LLLGVFIAALLLSRREKDFTQTIVLGLVGWQAIEHHRHMAFFAIAAGFWLGGHLQAVLDRLAGSTAKSAHEELGTKQKVALALGVLLAIGVAGWECGRKLTELRVDRSTFPVAAIDYVAEQGLHGRMVVTFNWAQYALAAVGAREPAQPGVRIHIDGRCRTSYSQELLDEHFDLILGLPDPSQRYRDPASPPYDPTRALRRGLPDLLLLSRAQQPSVDAVAECRGQWVLLYQDKLAQVWGRASRYDDPASSDYLPPAQRRITDDAQTGYAAWPALPDYRPRVKPSAQSQLVQQ
jgi:hypothetical protein